MDDKITDELNPISGISDAQSRIMDLLAPEEDKAENPEETIDESSLDEEGEVSEDEELEEEEEFDDEDAELVDDEQELDEEPEVAETFSVKIDGKDVEVDLQELKSGYSRTADYTRKSQALAEERKTSSKTETQWFWNASNTLSYSLHCRRRLERQMSQRPISTRCTRQIR